MQSQWSIADWKDLGYRTGTRKYIENHSRLLRSLSWGDVDYPGHVLDAIEHLIETDESNLDVLLEDASIKKWFADHDPELYSEFAKTTIAASVPKPSPRITSQTVIRAISDAEALIRSGGATSGVDRVHTALHGYFHAVCDDAGIEYPSDASLTQLFMLIKNNHEALRDMGPRGGDVVKIMRSFGAVADTLNPLRNNASLAHPNSNLLEEPEAMLVINAARTILHYLDVKLDAYKLKARDML